MDLSLLNFYAKVVSLLSTMSFCHDVYYHDQDSFYNIHKVSWWSWVYELVTNYFTVNFMNKIELKISHSITIFPCMILFLITSGLISFSTHTPPLGQHKKWPSPCIGGRTLRAHDGPCVARLGFWYLHWFGTYIPPLGLHKKWLTPSTGNRALWAYDGPCVAMVGSWGLLITWPWQWEFPGHTRVPALE